MSKFMRIGRALLVATAVLAAGLSCGGKKTLTASNGEGGGGVKLLETITDNNGTVQRFEYDEQNRIVKIDDKTIAYADNSITAGDQKFVINGNKVTAENGIYNIDKDGYIVGYEGGGIWTYKDGNLINQSSEYDNSNYSYDDKKSPFSNSGTPKWLISLLLYKYESKNNIATLNGSYEGEGEISTSYKYEYDGDGFPVAVTETEKHSAVDGITTRTTRFTYLVKPLTAAVKKKTAVSKKEAEKEARARNEAAAAAEYSRLMAEEAAAELAAAQAKADADAAAAVRAIEDPEERVKAQAVLDSIAAAEWNAAQKAKAARGVKGE